MPLYEATINGEVIKYNSPDGSYSSLQDLFAMAVTPISSFNQQTNAIVDFNFQTAQQDFADAQDNSGFNPDDFAPVQPVQAVPPAAPGAGFNGNDSAPGAGLGYGPGYTTGLWLGPVATGAPGATNVPPASDSAAGFGTGTDPVAVFNDGGLNPQPGAGGWVVTGPATPPDISAGNSGGSITPPVTAPNNGGNSTPQDGVSLDFDHVPDAPGHKYVGTQGNYDLWQLLDPAGTLLGWSVIIGHDSREIVPGTLHIISTGNATTATGAQINASGSPTGGVGGGGVGGGVAGTATTPGSSAATGTIQPTNSGATNTGLPTPGSNTNPTPTAGLHIQGNVRHKYIGSTGGYDIWQLVDEDNNIVEWASLMGRSSLEVVPGSSHYVTASVPSGTVIIGPVTTATPTPPTSPTGTAVVAATASPVGQLVGWGSLAGLAFELLK
jgi:hypothetical protein